MLNLEELREEYPHIPFRTQWTLTPEIAYLLGQCESLVKAIVHVPIEPSKHRELKLISLKKGAQATTAIEGNTLTDSDISMIVEGKSLPQSKEYQQIEVENVLEAMNHLVDEVVDNEQTQVISHDLLLRFHKMVGKNLGEHFDAIPGNFRTDFRVVGNSYRCPRPEHVNDLIAEFCKFLARDFNYTSGSQTFRDAVIQAIVAHIYLELIHPFGDGNGRTGRLLEFYILLRAGNPDIASHILSNHYNETRNEYYRQLIKLKNERDLTSFLEYALVGFKDGLESVLSMIQESQSQTAWKSHIYKTFEEAGDDTRKAKKSVLKRRRNLVLSMPIGVTLSLDELALLTTDLAREYAQLKERSLTRDLKILEDMNLVEKVGKKYQTNDRVLKMRMARMLGSSQLLNV